MPSATSFVTRRVIQVESTEAGLVAVCDDGSMFVLGVDSNYIRGVTVTEFRTGWVQLPNIPQPQNR